MPPFEETVRTKVGKRLETGIAEYFAEDNGWKIRPMTEYYQHVGLRMGSSFDFAIVSPETGEDIAILEIKNVDSLVFKNDWLDGPDGIEAAPHIELQGQQQMALSGIKKLYFGVLVGGNTPRLIERSLNESIVAKMKSKVAEFWTSIEENKPPPPDFRRDARFIASIYSHAEPGSVFDGQGDADLAQLAEGYRYACEQEKAAKLMKDTAKAQILMKIGTAEKALGAGFTVSAGVRGPVMVPEHERAGFRDFRVSWRKAQP